MQHHDLRQLLLCEVSTHCPKLTQQVEICLLETFIAGPLGLNLGQQLGYVALESFQGGLAEALTLSQAAAPRTSWRPMTLLAPFVGCVTLSPMRLVSGLLGLAATTWLTWCTVVAFIGGSLPLVGVHLDGGVGFGLFWLFVVDPLLGLVVYGIGFGISAAVASGESLPKRRNTSSNTGAATRSGTTTSPRSRKGSVESHRSPERSRRRALVVGIFLGAVALLVAADAGWRTYQWVELTAEATGEEFWQDYTQAWCALNSAEEQDDFTNAAADLYLAAHEAMERQKAGIRQADAMWIAPWHGALAEARAAFVNYGNASVTWLETEARWAEAWANGRPSGYTPEADLRLTAEVNSSVGVLFDALHRAEPLWRDDVERMEESLAELEAQDPCD